MKISEIITDKYKLRLPPTVYYELLADVQEAEEEQEPTTKNDLGVDCISRAEAIKCLECDFDITGKENMKTVVNYINSAHDKIVNLPRVKQEPTDKNFTKADYEARLKENNELINDLEELRTMINKFAESYEKRLKADLVAMLTDLKNKLIDKSWNIDMYDDDLDFECCYLNDIDEVIQQKINALKAENEVDNGNDD